MTVNRSAEHVIWLTEMFFGDGVPSDQTWKEWQMSYPFDTWVALREWHRYFPPYLPWVNGESNNDHHIYWTETDVDRDDKESKTYWRATETEVMNVKNTLTASIIEDDKHLTDVTHKMRQHAKEYGNERRRKLGIK